MCSLGRWRHHLPATVPSVSQQSHGYGGTCLGVGEGMVVAAEVKSAIFCHCLQLIIGQQTPQACPRRAARAVECVSGIVHLVRLEDSLQTALVERRVMSHEGQALYAWGYLTPHVGEWQRILNVKHREAVDTCCPVCEEVRAWVDEAVEGIGYLAVPDYYDANAAYA